MAAASDDSASEAVGRTLIAGVGHRFWGDRSAGPLWVDRMADRDWPSGVVLDDLSFGALAMTQQLQAQPFDRIAFVTAEERGREPATLHWSRHTAPPASPEHVQACVGEAGGGVVAIDLLLVIAGYYRALPADTWILEIEPADAAWGDGLSQAVDQLYPRAFELLWSFAVGSAPTAVVEAWENRDMLARPAKESHEG